ncbi:hypothetical protein PVAP13_4KG338388 [Panicum virgatum]|uniref:Uncharacterized protein n=1 Tax=Panicum virgatum TaxID=38727 RepID=A0A8T0TWW4_PANVG|nr:hypothetical protein PVAP13_4KG338388 [Panicum virgatum]
MAMAPGSTRDSCGTPSNSPAAHSAPLVVTHSSSCTLLRPRQRRAGRGPPDGHTAQMLYQRQSVSDSAAAIIRAAEWIPSPVSSISVDEPESFSVRIYPKSFICCTRRQRCFFLCISGGCHNVCYCRCLWFVD